MDRAVDVVAVRQRFLIVCEGSKTEPQYFEQFRVPGLVVKVEGIGMNTLSLVDKAIELSKLIILITLSIELIQTICRLHTRTKHSSSGMYCTSNSFNRRLTEQLT